MNWRVRSCSAQSLSRFAEGREWMLVTGTGAFFFSFLYVLSLFRCRQTTVTGMKCGSGFEEPRTYLLT